MDKNEYKYQIIFNLRKNGKMTVADLRQSMKEDRQFSGRTADGWFCKIMIDFYYAKFITVTSKSKNNINNNEFEELMSRYDGRPHFASLGDGFDLALRINPEDVLIELTDYFYRIQEVTGFSISDTLTKDSYWHRKSIWEPANDKLKSQVFVIMPFCTEIEPVYTDHIKKKCNEIGYDCLRADDIFSATNIMNDIWSLIKQSNVIICDCTGRNPNVFYELGLAHAIGRNVICITQNEDDIPFDISSIRYIKYDFTPRGMMKFEDELEKYLAIAMTEALAEQPRNY